MRTKTLKGKKPNDCYNQARELGCMDWNVTRFVKEGGFWIMKVREPK